MALSTAITWDNTALPFDTSGSPLLTGEFDVLQVDDTYYLYVNNWGGCPGVDCCDSPSGCSSCCFNPPSDEFPDSCVYTTNHSVVVYSTTNFKYFRHRGVALPLTGGNRAEGVEFRPHVVYNAKTGLFIMWYEDRWVNGTDNPGYAVATSESPEGPFKTVQNSTTMATSSKIGDFDIFIDDDGKAYHVRTRFVVELLTDDYLDSARSQWATFEDPSGAGESPVMFKRADTYFILYGSDCCACKGGSSISVVSASSPLGPFTALGEIGTNSSGLFSTNAQGSAVFEIPNSNGSAPSTIIWAGNQWVTSQFPGKPRNHDLLYLTPLKFLSNGSIALVDWSPAVELPFLHRQALAQFH